MNEEHTQRRKDAMAAAGLTGVQIADGVGCSEGMVSQVINGDRLEFPASRRVMAYVAQRLGTTPATLWPELNLTHEPQEPK